MQPSRSHLLRLLLCLLLLGVGGTVMAQSESKKISERKREIERLEKQIAEREKEISTLQKGRSSAEQRARKLARQIESRNDLLERSEAEEQEVIREVEQTDSTLQSLTGELESCRARYAEMVREAYRNYHHNNYLSYLFSAENFADVARRLANLREVASLRSRQIARIAELERSTRAQQEVLTFRRQQLDSVQRSLAAQKRSLQRDASEAKKSIKSLSKREQEALNKKLRQERQLDAAIAELRKLTKGNKEGAGFSSKTSNLRLPVEGGRVKKYHGNMAEISGSKGARVLSIYEGKVVDVKQNRITGKYDVYVAHGEYITSYANLSQVVVEKGGSVNRNQQLGIIGSTVDILTMKNEYLLIFGIYPPSANQKMLASDCFKK